MSEHNSRISMLAVSAVITVGAVACSSTPPPHQNPPVPTVGLENPPPERDKGNLVTRDDGTCWLEFEADCDPDVKCNPPAPQQIDCPEEATTAGLPKPDTSKEITERADGSCWQVGEMPEFNCPPPDSGFTCNPPPIPWTEVECAPEIRLPDPGPGPIDARADGTCWQSPPIPKFECPKSRSGVRVSCNPPMPQLTQVNCPPKETTPTLP